MGVYIKKMKMPKTCADCELLKIQSTDDWVGKYCPLVKRYIDFLESTKHRYVDCQIVAEIPEPHGDLIDRSMLDPDSEYEDGDFWAVSVAQIELMPPVIEAEGRKDGENNDD